MFERVGLGWVGLGGMLRGMYGKGLVLRLVVCCVSFE